MNKRVKKLWIAALRSGKIKQAKAQLRNDDRRCCLGVLCDVFKRATGKGRWKHNGRVWTFIVGDEQDSFVLPEPVRAWAGLPDANPNISTRVVASSANDSGKSFEYIADRIEKYL